MFLDYSILTRITDKFMTYKDFVFMMDKTLSFFTHMQMCDKTHVLSVQFIISTQYKKYNMKYLKQ